MKFKTIPYTVIDIDDMRLPEDVMNALFLLDEELEELGPSRYFSLEDIVTLNQSSLLGDELWPILDFLNTHNITHFRVDYE